MKPKNLLDAMGGIDGDLIEEAERYRKRRNIPLWTKIGALAACLAMVVSMGLLWMKGEDPQSVIGDPRKLTGVQELAIGDREYTVGKASYASPGFPLQTVIEARVVEVLPDTYRPCEGIEVHVAKLEVLDVICSDGMPEEIYLCYPYYDTAVFDGYDRLILSVRQIGVENYLLLNTTQKQVEFFPHMFEAFFDPGYGPVIAFKDGVIDTGFWEKANHTVSRIPHGEDQIRLMLENADEFGYPATYGDTPDDVKARIRKLATEGEGAKPRNYRTAEDILPPSERKVLLSYLSPDSGNLFANTIETVIDNRGNVVQVLKYTRVVNGFLTDEVITVDLDSGKVERSEEKYSSADLSKLPDLGAELAEMNLSALVPPHVTLVDGMQLIYAQASGYYRMAGSEVYGIIRVKWLYRPDSGSNALLQDDYYCLYDDRGNSRVLERDALKEIIGDDSLIEIFSYDLTFYK